MNNKNTANSNQEIAVALPKVVLVTGAARRIGAEIATMLHDSGYLVVIHYHHSKTDAEALANSLNAKRADSTFTVSSDLGTETGCEALITKTLAIKGRLDALINNASVFYPTAVDAVSTEQWQQIFNTNLRAPFILSQKAARALNESTGSIINITDIHGSRPLEGYSVYSMSKAGLISMTQSLAKELAPEIRVNSVSPGAILWPEKEGPEHESDDEAHKEILSRIPLNRLGAAENIAQTVLFLLQNNYITGQTINVDGGRSLSQ